MSAGKSRMNQADEIEVLIEEIGDGVIVRPVGDIDLRGASSLRVRIGEVQRRNPARLVIDLTEVPYMDASVVATLVEAMQVARLGSGILILCGLQERVRSVFEITRLDNAVFTIVETTDQAIALPNRRKFTRFGPFGLNCDLGHLLDISARGVKLLSKRKLKGTVNLRLWNNETDLDLQAEVCWSQRIRFRQHEEGLQFANLRTEDAKKLAVMVELVREAEG